MEDPIDLKKFPEEFTPDFIEDSFSLNASKGIFIKKGICHIEILNGNNIRYFFNKNISDIQKTHILLNQPLAYAIFQREGLALHSSAVEIEGKAYLFIGPSGAGKSFFISQMLEFSNFISEDVSRISFINNKVYIENSHPLIKLDNISSENFFTFHEQILMDKRKRSCFSVNKEFFRRSRTEVGGCFFLDFSSDFKIKRLNIEQSLASILFSAFLSNPFFSEPNVEKKIHSKIMKFLNKVPIFHLSRKKEFADFKLIKNYIISKL